MHCKWNSVSLSFFMQYLINYQYAYGSEFLNDVQLGPDMGQNKNFRSAKSHLFSLKLHISSFNTHPNILGYSQQINCYSLLKWTIFKAANGGERPWVIYAPLQRMHRELKYYSPEFSYNILMRCISQCAKYKLCIFFFFLISSVWNLRKRHEFVDNIARFLFPFFSLVSFFRDI